jgi:hypothetical protein
MCGSKGRISRLSFSYGHEAFELGFVSEPSVCSYDMTLNVPLPEAAFAVSADLAIAVAAPASAPAKEFSCETKARLLVDDAWCKENCKTGHSGVCLTTLCECTASIAERFEYDPRPGYISAGHDLDKATMTVAAAQEKCTGMPECKGFTFFDAEPVTATTTKEVFFKSWADFNAAPNWHAYVQRYTAPLTETAATVAKQAAAAAAAATMAAVAAAAAVAGGAVAATLEAPPAAGAAGAAEPAAAGAGAAAAGAGASAAGAAADEGGVAPEAGGVGAAILAAGQAADDTASGGAAGESRGESTAADAAADAAETGTVVLACDSQSQPASKCDAAVEQVKQLLPAEGIAAAATVAANVAALPTAAGAAGAGGAAAEGAAQEQDAAAEDEGGANGGSWWSSLFQPVPAGGKGQSQSSSQGGRRKSGGTGAGAGEGEGAGAGAGAGAGEGEGAGEGAGGGNRTAIQQLHEDAAELHSKVQQLLLKISELAPACGDGRDTAAADSIDDSATSGVGVGEARVVPG